MTRKPLFGMARSVNIPMARRVSDRAKKAKPRAASRNRGLLRLTAAMMQPWMRKANAHAYTVTAHPITPLRLNFLAVLITNTSSAASRITESAVSQNPLVFHGEGRVLK